jgi:hypothetical protein
MEYWKGHKKGQSREAGNIEYTRRRKTKQNHNIICVGHHFMQRNAYYVNKIAYYLLTSQYNLFLFV